MKINGLFSPRVLTGSALLLVISAYSNTVLAQKAFVVRDVATANNVSLVVRDFTKTMRDGTPVPFWVFCTGCMGMNNTGLTLPGPILELTAGTPGQVTLNMMMAPQEDTGSIASNAYLGHTIHLHGLDMDTQNDGVPESYAAQNSGSSVTLREGVTYMINPPGTVRVDDRYIGSHMYHCHVHTVKHLEMGMYGMFIVKGGGALAGHINAAGPKYDEEWNMMLSTVDPRYHTAAAKGDSTIFADYIPKYFLINGEEGYDVANPSNLDLRHSVTLAGQSKNLVIRLMGILSTQASFEIRDANNVALPFTLYNVDGFALKTPQTVTQVQISPGQTKDIMVTLTTAGVFYPQVQFSDLRSAQPYPNGLVKTELTVVQ
ncbi:MAG: multicopper oxidase domain-containing protein [Gammaproteobacteria bacterium]|nr:multicopper oxidase domain-containing protein [Gammaproteobacteria bacterium]